MEANREVILQMAGFFALPVASDAILVLQQEAAKVRVS